MTRNMLCSLLAAAGVTLAVASSAEATPTKVSFAGRLHDEIGPVEGAVQLQFRIFDGATQIWSESHAAVATDDGVVFALLGTTTPLDADVFTGAALELEVAIDGDTLQPRLPIVSVPYAARSAVAARAEDADQLGGQPPTAYASASHDHEGEYLPIGTMTSCGAADKVIAINAMGNVMCAPDRDTNTTYGADPVGGLALNGTAFAIANGGVTSPRIGDNAVVSAKIADNAVVSTKIADGSISAADIATGAVGAAEIADGSVGAAEIADGSVGASKIGTSAVGSDEIASAAVTNAELAVEAVRRSNISGAEVAIYTVPAGCYAGGADGLGERITTNGSDCPTVLCEAIPPRYYSCGGGCSATSSQSCAKTFLGYLLSPTGN